MRKNFPITELQTQVPENQYLISKTDLKGRITYVNPSFIEISGFSFKELIGQAHNIVRHPHSPPSIFADMWQQLKRGEQWQGVIKNRRKDGGYYWVHARIIPIIENGEHTGYASIRVRPSEQQIAQASQQYERFTQDPSSDRSITPSLWKQRLDNIKKLLFANNYRSHLLRVGSLLAATIGAASLQSLAPTAPAFNYSFIAVLTIVLLSYGWVVCRKMLQTLDQTTLIAQQIAIGNLNIHINHERTVFETRQLNFFLNHMRGCLQNVISDSSRSIYASQHVGRELYQSSQHLAERTDEQLHALTRTSQHATDLNQLVQQSVDHTQVANDLILSTQQAANQGGQDVQTVVQSMQDIHQSSNQIADITNLIEDIAFQTNILALNAAVESARAGEAGRGFAVVAAEVRSLAQRSSKAAGEIKDLIETSQQHVNRGVQQAQQAGNSMAQIVNAVDVVQQTIAQMTHSNHAQTQGIEQLQTALHNLENLSQQNHQMVATLHNSVSHLGGQNRQLQHAIAALGV